MTYPIKIITKNNSELEILDADALKLNLSNGIINFDSLVSLEGGRWQPLHKTEYADVILESIPHHRIGPDGSTFYEKLLWMYFSPYGRISRMTFWIYSIISALIILAFGVIQTLYQRYTTGLSLEKVYNNEAIYTLYSYFFQGFCVGIISIPMFFLVKKRMNDRNRPNLISFLSLIPLINIWPLFEAGFLKGEQRPNRHGPSAL